MTPQRRGGLPNQLYNHYGKLCKSRRPPATMERNGIPRLQWEGWMRMGSHMRLGLLGWVLVAMLPTIPSSANSLILSSPCVADGGLLGAVPQLSSECDAYIDSPDTEELHRATALTDRASAYLESSFPEKALSDADHAIRLLAGEPRLRSRERRTVYLAHGVRAKIRRTLGLYEHAAEDIAEALRLSPKEPDLHVATADVLVLAGRVEDGIAAYERALALQPRNFSATIGRGVAFAKLGETGRALQDFDAAAEFRQSDRFAGIWLCLAKAKAGLLAEAMRDCDRADPHDALAQTARGIVLLKSGQDRAALENFTRSLAAAGAHHVLARYGRCQALQRLGQRNAAKRDCVEARRSPGFITAQRIWFVEQGIQ